MRYFFVLIVALCLASTLNAQIRVGINFNLSNQPAWGPTGYDYVGNYYFPDIEVYYNVPTHRYYYNQRGRWISSSYLPSRYGNFDLYNSYKVVVNDRDPWRNHNNYRDQYSTYKGQRGQQPIRDSRDSKYFVNKNHPEHNNWVKQQRNENNNRNDRNRNDNQNDNRGKQDKGKNKK